jgi:glucosamine 6-phosphate synthetase-like amidotransferase/phosphosugar isomerase protein
MTTKTLTIHNVETGEIITREMNSEELAQDAADKSAYQAFKEAETKAEAEKIAATAKLAALGLTADDLKALGL